MSIKSLLKDEKGASLPFVAIILGLFALAFIALVVDAGVLYINRKAMVTSADAAALAGAQVLRASKGLNETGAKTAAENYAKANGADPDKVEVFVGKKPVTIPNGTTETRQVVEVTVGKNQPLIFARFLNDEEANVKAHAIATWGYVRKSSYMPIFIFNNGYKLNQAITLHNNLPEDNVDFKTNSYGFVSISSNSSMDDIKRAIEGTLNVEPKSIGNILDGIPGKRESVYDAAKTRINDTVVIPVIDWEKFKKRDANIDNKGNINGNAQKWELPVMFFAYFEVTDVIKQNDNGNNGNGGGKGNGGDNGSNSVKIVGRFTGKTVDVRSFIEAGDQANPNGNGDSPAAYIKLIE